MSNQSDHRLATVATEAVPARVLSAEGNEKTPERIHRAGPGTDELSQG